VTHVIYRAEEDGPFELIETTTATRWQDTKVTDGNGYRWQVAARNRGGESPPCLPVSATPGPGLPATPTGLTSTAADTFIDLAWKPVGGATGYRVWRASGPDQEQVLLATVEKPGYRDQNLKNGTSWWYAVEAVAAAGTGGRSKALRAMARPPLLPAPEELTWERGENIIDGVAKPGVTIRWKPVPGAVRYNVRVANIKRGLYISRGAVRDETTWFLTDELARGVAWIRVSAVNATGEGEPTEPVLMPVEPVKKPD
jgi:fibronectin type 3 domain-containing protein